jgi:uncharacterized coiled-coil DUF342 family protein
MAVPYGIMSKDNQIAVRFNDRTYEAVKKFAEEYDLTHAEAIRRITEGRLAGEGYLSGPTLADGGQGFEKMEETHDIVEEVSDEVSSLSKQLDDTDDVSQEVASLSEQLQKIMLPLTVAILWIGTEATVGIPYSPLSVVVTGVPLILWLTYPQLRDKL